MGIRYLSLKLFLLGCISLSAQTDGFYYRREIGPVVHDWHRIDIPAPVFGKVNPDLSDLRIISISATGDTLAVPYHIMNKVSSITEMERSFSLINQTSVHNVHYYTFDLRARHEVNSILLEIENSNYDWHVHLEGSHTQKEWFTIVGDYRILSIKNPDVDYTFSTLSFPKVDYQYFRVRFESSEKPKLLHASVKLKVTTNEAINEYESSIKVAHNNKQKQSSIIVTTPNKVPISTLHLSFDNKFDFYRKVSVSYLYDSVKVDSSYRKHYRYCTSGIVSSFEESVFNFEPVISNEFLVTVENHDNFPVNPIDVTLSGPIYYLIARFPSTSDDTYLYYGNPMANKPNYDISKFIASSPDSIAGLKVGEEELMVVNKPILPLIADKRWLWGTIIVMMLILGWFSFKMLRKS